MKPLIALSIACILISSCHKEEKIENKCTISHLPLDYAKQSNALIPINTRNFWTYTDSIFNTNTGAFENVSSTLINIDNLNMIDGLTYFDFTELLPPMTLTGDTLSTIETGNTGSSCYTLKKYLFPVKDTVATGTSSLQKLYPDTTTIRTAAGDFANNTVYKDGESMRMYLHEGIGLVKLEIRLSSGKLKRSLTLKDYKIN